MQNNDLSNSLYFSNQSQFKQRIYRGYFMLKNTNISILETKNKIKYETNRTELNESFFISNSLQQIQSKKVEIYDNLSCLENSQEQKILKKPLKGHQFTSNLKPSQKLQQILPQLSTTQQVVIVDQNKFIYLLKKFQNLKYSNFYLILDQIIKQTKLIKYSILSCSLKLQSRLQKAKPLVKQQKFQEYIIQLRYLNKQFEELQKGLILKCLYIGTNDRDQSIDKIVIMNFENFLLQQRKNFWDFRIEMKICPSFLRGSIVQQCESPYCPCALRNDLKNTLKILSKTYLIVFLFNSLAFAQVWQKYLFYNGFFIDAIYCLNNIQIFIIMFKLNKLYITIHYKNQTQTQQQLGGIKLNQIIRDFSRFKITKILHFDSVDMTNTFPIIQAEQFQNKLPILSSNIETILFIFQQLQNPKQFDSKLICDICVSFSKDNNHDHQQITSRKSVTIIPVDITYAYHYYQLKEKKQQDKSQIVHKLILVQDQLQSNIDTYDSNLIEQEEEEEGSQFRWVDSTHNKIQEQIQRDRLKEKTLILNNIIGDLIVRNHKFKKIYFNYPEQQLIKKQQLINKKIVKLKSEMIVQQNKLKNLLCINCFLCIE